MEEAEEEEIKNKNSLEQLLTGDLQSPFPTELSPGESVRHVVRALISKYQCFVCSRSKSVKILFLDFFLGGGWRGGGGGSHTKSSGWLMIWTMPRKKQEKNTAQVYSD